MRTKREIVSAIAVGVALLCGWALLLSRVAKERTNAKLFSTLSNGRGIFNVLFAEDSSEFIAEPRQPYPSTAVYSNSTEYFLAMVEHGPLHVDFSFFAGAGMTPATGTTFTADNNAWCIMGDIAEAHSGQCPILFTRNLHFSNDNGKVVAYISDTPPFGTIGAAVVYLDGSGAVIRAEDLQEVADGMHPNHVSSILRP